LSECQPQIILGVVNIAGMSLKKTAAEVVNIAGTVVSITGIGGQDA
jgi:hypothetical protein